MKTIRWGMIGCGSVTEKKSGPGFYKARNSMLAAVASRSPGKAADYASRHGIAKAYGSAEELIADPEIDAVYIATPPASHKDYALKAAAAGKAVYMEKPMAMNYAECREVIDFCAKKGVPVFIPYYRRAMDRFLRIREAVVSGEIGRPLFVEIMLRKPPTEEELSDRKPWRVVQELSGGGIFVDMGLHMIDFAQYCLGEISEVSGQATNLGGFYGVEDTVTASWRHESGALGSGTWCFACADAEDRVTIAGTEGTVRFSFFSQAPISIEGKKGKLLLDIPDPEHVQQPFIQSVVDELNGAGRCPGTVESAARATWVADQVLAAYRKERGFA